MVQRVASIRTYRLTPGEAGVEHQNAAWSAMFSEDSKHPPLVVVAEMKEAVPSQDCAKSPTKGQRPHIGDDPFLIRHPGSAERDQRRRAVHAGDAKAMRRHMKSYRSAAPTTEIKDSRSP